MQWELAVQQYTAALKLATDPTDVATLLCLRSTAYARSTPQSRLPVHTYSKLKFTLHVPAFWIFTQ